jgi:hypothetical protein
MNKSPGSALKTPSLAAASKGFLSSSSSSPDAVAAVKSSAPSLSKSRSPEEQEEHDRRRTERREKRAAALAEEEARATALKSIEAKDKSKAKVVFASSSPEHVSREGAEEDADEEAEAEADEDDEEALNGDEAETTYPMFSSSKEVNLENQPAFKKLKIALESKIDTISSRFDSLQEFLMQNHALGADLPAKKSEHLDDDSDESSCSMGSEEYLEDIIKSSKPQGSTVNDVDNLHHLSSPFFVSSQGSAGKKVSLDSDACNLSMLQRAVCKKLSVPVSIKDPLWPITLLKLQILVRDLSHPRNKEECHRHFDALQFHLQEGHASSVYYTLLLFHEVVRLDQDNSEVADKLRSERQGSYEFDHRFLQTHSNSRGSSPTRRNRPQKRRRNASRDRSKERNQDHSPASPASKSRRSSYSARQSYAAAAAGRSSYSKNEAQKQSRPQTASGRYQRSSYYRNNH